MYTRAATDGSAVASFHLGLVLTNDQRFYGQFGHQRSSNSLGRRAGIGGAPDDIWRRRRQRSSGGIGGPDIGRRRPETRVAVELHLVHRRALPLPLVARGRHVVGLGLLPVVAVRRTRPEAQPAELPPGRLGAVPWGLGARFPSATAAARASSLPSLSFLVRSLTGPLNLCSCVTARGSQS